MECAAREEVLAYYGDACEGNVFIGAVPGFLRLAPILDRYDACAPLPVLNASEDGVGRHLGALILGLARVANIEDVADLEDRDDESGLVFNYAVVMDRVRTRAITGRYATRAGLVLDYGLELR